VEFPNSKIFGEFQLAMFTTNFPSSDRIHLYNIILDVGRRGFFLRKLQRQVEKVTELTIKVSRRLFPISN